MNAVHGIVLSYSEVQFILEAAEKGYIPGGSSAAAGYSLNGMEDQFNYYAGRIGSNYSASYLAKAVMNAMACSVPLMGLANE